MDISPKGDAPGFVRVPDKTPAIPDRPGNQRFDSAATVKIAYAEQQEAEIASGHLLVKPDIIDHALAAAHTACRSRQCVAITAPPRRFL